MHIKTCFSTYINYTNVTLTIVLHLYKRVDTKPTPTKMHFINDVH